MYDNLAEHESGHLQKVQSSRHITRQSCRRRTEQQNSTVPTLSKRVVGAKRAQAKQSWRSEFEIEFRQKYSSWWKSTYLHQEINNECLLQFRENHVLKTLYESYQGTDHALNTLHDESFHGTNILNLPAFFEYRPASDKIRRTLICFMSSGQRKNLSKM